ncbi:biotin--[acetyl-CoA-carboxylase] ligase [Curtobacterium sp. RRHDQ10]|uniref:biotin--[acetyl-CoA-carboxylase] ligase n=1 Tax=Curtobacterium phyllosphaerae TaxID=3413379 RepID=UPI003BEFD368
MSFDVPAGSPAAEWGFPRARTAGVPLTVVASTGSTNADMTARPGGTGHLAVLVALAQTAGRGRLDRTWSAPAGQTLAASVLVRAALPPVVRGWLPLVAGTAMRTAVAGVLPDRAVTVKWPNDVLVGGRKVCGILAQVATDGAVVVGAGVNLTIPADDLPTPTATSLTVEGAVGSSADLADLVLTAWWSTLRDHVEALARGGRAATGVFDAVRAACGTIGLAVRVELPDGDRYRGTATGLDDDGRLLVRGADDAVSAISVGDVTHLRHD